MNKQLYKIIFVLGSCMATVTETDAQCTCANGSIPDSVVYTFTLAPTASFSNAITFPKFNPTTGTLTCVTLRSSITAVANLSIRNLDSLQRDYEFLYTQAIAFSGPGGLTTNANTSLHYGPKTLDPYGTPGTDSAHFGPDTPFRNQFMSKTVTNTAPYLGVGNVTVNFTNTGSTLLLQGSNNYQSTVSTFAWGDFRMSYYWCASAPLAVGIRNFYVSRKEHSLLLQWLVENEIPNTTYEVQMSNDGHVFTAMKGQIIKKNNAGLTAGYSFEFRDENYFSNKLFFRVKQLEAGGKYTYSAVKTVDFLHPDNESMSISPNPVIRKMNISFTTPQTGSFAVQVVNDLGQSLYYHFYSLADQTSLEFQLDQNTRPGLYYLRLNNLKTKEQMVRKILIR